jgi:citrate synthase
MDVQWYHPGLEGVAAGETNICSLDPGLTYRGSCIYDLAEHANFLEVVHLLLFEELPTAEQLADLECQMADAAPLPPAVLSVLEDLPLHVSAVDVLRTGVTLCANDDSQCIDGSDGEGEGKAAPLLARIPMILGAWSRIRDGLEPAEWSADDSYAANLYRLLRDQGPTPSEERALNAALIVAAEQEFTPATFAARIVGSADADLYSAVIAALSVHSGRRHSGDYEAILALLESFDDPEEAAEWAQRQTSPENRLPGFGHPAFTTCDPRAAVLERWTHALARQKGQEQIEQTADSIEQGIWQARSLPPNLDWPFTRLLHYLEIPGDLHLAVFLCARAVGWCAHALEQAQSGQVIRPRARYRGVESTEFVPLHRRD